MSPRHVLRVLIVDDEPLARARIEDLLRRQPDVASFDVALSPPWGAHVPADVTRIHVKVGGLQ